VLAPVAGARLPGSPAARVQVMVPLAPPESVAPKVTPARPAVALADFPRVPGPPGAGGRGYRTLTRASSCPSPSTVWMAQARHGSKEWTVRSASSGFLASAMGLPTSDAS